MILLAVVRNKKNKKYPENCATNVDNCTAGGICHTQNRLVCVSHVV